MKLVLVIVALAACSKAKPDECQTIIDKSRTVMAELGKQMGKPASPKDEALLLDRCHDSLVSGKREKAMDCILAAKDDDGVRACLTDGLKSYRDHAKTSEAKVMLNKIGKNAKIAFIDAQQFPAGNAPLTPATPCCKQPGNLCAPEPADWTNPAWQALNMSIDEPFRFQYSYQSDGKTFTATATGDPSCDGNPVTQTTRGMIENGEPRITEE